MVASVAFALLLTPAFFLATSLSEELPRTQPELGRRMDSETRGLTAYARAAIVERHNDMRGMVVQPCTAANMETLVWDSNLALEAQTYADTCIADADATRGRVGENIGFQTFQEQSMGLGYSIADLLRFVQFWYDEGPNVDWTDNSPYGTKLKSKILDNPPYDCTLYDPDSGVCSIEYFTQLAWATTNKIGCGAVVCNDGLTLRGFTYASGINFVCRYSPQGNAFALGPGAAHIAQPWTCGGCCERCASVNFNCTTGLCPAGVSPTRPHEMSCNPTTTSTNTSTTTTYHTTTSTTTSTTTTSTSSTTTTTTTSTTTTTTTTTYCLCLTPQTTTPIRPCTPATCPDFLPDDRRLTLTSSPLQTIVEQQRAALVSKHNELRSAVSSPCTASDMETMVWDSALATQSQDYANTCVFESDSERGAVGENFFWTQVSSSSDTPDLLEVLQGWHDELADVDWSLYSDGPVSKIYPDPKSTCKRYAPTKRACFIGDYTQIVWAKSNKVGCGAAVCSLDADATFYFSFVCRYSPKGNLVVPPGVPQAIVNSNTGLLAPFTLGLPCAACASTCATSGLCDIGVSPKGCFDTVMSRAPLKTLSSCSELMAWRSDWCSTDEPSFGRCPFTCGTCSAPSGVGANFCDTTTTSTNSTTTSTTTAAHLLTTAAVTLTTTSEPQCVWTCFSSFDDIPTTFTFTTRLRTTSTTTLPTVSKDLVTFITGSLVLTVPDDFTNDDEAKSAVASGIADAFGVPHSYVTLTGVKPFASGKIRRLGESVTVEYTVTIPASATSAMKIEAPKRATAVSVGELTIAIQTSVSKAKGNAYRVAVNSKTPPVIRTAMKPKVATTSSRSRLQSTFSSCMLMAIVIAAL